LEEERKEKQGEKGIEKVLLNKKEWQKPLKKKEAFFLLPLLEETPRH
jgi:hypothetical protein